MKSRPALGDDHGQATRGADGGVGLRRPAHVQGAGRALGPRARSTCARPRATASRCPASSSPTSPTPTATRTASTSRAPTPSSTAASSARRASTPRPGRTTATRSSGPSTRTWRSPTTSTGRRSRRASAASSCAAPTTPPTTTSGSIWAGKMEMVTPEMPHRSDNWYGWAKAAYELLGFVFATGKVDGKQLEVVAVAHRRAARRRRSRPGQAGRHQGDAPGARRLSLAARPGPAGDPHGRGGGHRRRARRALPRSSTASAATRTASGASPTRARRSATRRRTTARSTSPTRSPRSPAPPSASGRAPEGAVTGPSHRDMILDQFSRQAVPFSTAPGIMDEQALRLIGTSSGRTCRG